MFIKRSNKQLIKSLSQTLTNSIDDLSNNISSTLSQISYVVDAEGEKDGDTIVFATGMGAPMEDASGNIPAFGIPCKKGSIKEVAVISTTPSLQDVSFIELNVSVYDSSGSTQDSTNNFDYSGNNLVELTNINLPDNLNQVVLKHQGDISSLEPFTRFRISLTLIPA